MDTQDGEKQVIRVTILNQTYSVVASGDPRDTEQLAQQVDDLMANIARRAGNLDTTRTAVLACLHLADKLRTRERELERLTQCVSRKGRSFLELLDSVLLAQPSE